MLDKPKTIISLDERSVPSESSDFDALESIAITERFVGLELNCGSNFRKLNLLVDKGIDTTLGLYIGELLSERACASADNDEILREVGGISGKRIASVCWVGGVVGQDVNGPGSGDRQRERGIVNNRGVFSASNSS